jgi:hypothetical protein
MFCVWAVPLQITEISLMQIIAPPFALPFLQPSLAFSLIYIWSRKNPHEQVALFWIIQLPAPYVRAPFCALIRHLTYTHLASHRNDCDIRVIGRQYAIARGRHRRMHSGPYCLVPDGGMAIRDEFRWRMVPAQTTTSIVSCCICSLALHYSDNPLQKRSTRGSITLYLLQMYQYLLLG